MRRAKLVEARKAAGKTQEQVAEHVDVDRTTVGNWERGLATPQPHQRPAYAEAIGISLSELHAILSSLPLTDEVAVSMGSVRPAEATPSRFVDVLVVDEYSDALRHHARL